MASKILMGNMPELMEDILNNLNNEFYSLYSCALVSRHWCKISIPILWRDPFSFEKKPLFISNYFSSLGEDEKFVLRKCGINADLSKKLFDYARFLKVLDLSRLESKVNKWLDLELVNSNYYISLMYHIINILIKLFIESGATLRKLDLHFSEFLEFSPEIFYSLGENKKIFSQLQDLSLGIILDSSIESVTTLLKILAKNTTKIRSLKFDGFYSDYEPQLFHALLYALICIIKSQEQLRQFSLIGGEDFPSEFYGIISALESQQNSLQEVIIENCGYSEEFEILNNCKKLEILRIRYCSDEILLKILNHQVNTLEIVDYMFEETTISTIKQILEKCGTSLQRLMIDSIDDEIWEESLLLDSLKSFCPNITYLYISNVEFSTQLVELIGKLQKLQFLTLVCNDFISGEELKTLVIQFAEILPLTLQYLDFRDDWLNSFIDILLNHCSAPLKKLLIDHLVKKKYAKALIEFCTRNKTLNYVGVDRYLKLNKKIRKEVKKYVTLVPYEHIVVNC
ncbi:hypothetical protein C2G38_2137014 [Gigaspora rosea]|uniref:F-box domain-containing protein n=1 Tax=Gigaspora rosea TaxID=44941 RepID=A0A397W4Z8_9GLOM|nr:hypothetical protein C2G38_2137014 [Gigaspora rosea]